MFLEYNLGVTILKTKFFLKEYIDPGEAQANIPQ